MTIGEGKNILPEEPFGFSREAVGEKKNVAPGPSSSAGGASVGRSPGRIDREINEVLHALNMSIANYKDIKETTFAGKKMIALTRMFISSSPDSFELSSFSKSLKKTLGCMHDYLSIQSKRKKTKEVNFRNLSEVFEKLKQLEQKVATKSKILAQNQLLTALDQTTDPAAPGPSEAPVSTAPFVKCTDKFSALLKTPDLPDRLRNEIEALISIHREYPKFEHLPINGLNHQIDRLQNLVGESLTDMHHIDIANNLILHMMELQISTEASFHRQEELLNSLNQKYSPELRFENLFSFAELSESEIAGRIPQSLLISLQQFLLNPLDWNFTTIFHPTIDRLNPNPLDVLLNTLAQEASMRGLTNYDLIQTIASSYPDESGGGMSKTEIIELKRQNVQLISEGYPALSEEDHRCLILGSGPGGLIQALKRVQMRQPVTLIERRQEDQLYGRDNIIVLGTLGNGDTEILRHFGITEQLELSNEIGHWIMDKESQTMTIGTLEQAMSEALTAINTLQEKSILKKHYGASVKDVEVIDGKAHITIEQSGAGEMEIIDPKEVIIAEGAHSKTRVLLGVETEQTSKTKKISVSFFKHAAPLRHERTLYKIKAGLSSFPLLARYGIDGAIRPKEAEEKLFRELQSLLLQTPQTDYIYKYLPPALIDQLRKIDGEIKVIEMEMDSLSRHSDSPRVEELKKVLEILLDKKDKILGLDANKRRSYWDTAYAHIFPEHRMEPAIFEKAFTVDVRVTGADSFGAKIGTKTRAFFVGDALQTTDPIAGAGCSSAIAIAKGLVLHESPFCMEIYADFASGLRRRMVDEAFERREMNGISGTEFLEHYTAIAVDGGALTREDELFLKELITRSKNVRDAPEMRFLEAHETERLLRIKGILDIKFMEISGKSPANVERFKQKYVGHALHSKKRRTARALASKKAITDISIRGRTERNPEGWYLGILLGIDHIEKTLNR